ncbi:MAG: phosphotyrosine protein phosphatase [Pseudomonadota bacterium]
MSAELRSAAHRHYLFVCSQNKLRSPTAEHAFAEYPGIITMSAGTNRGAENPLTDELVEWADVIFAMERQHRSKLQKTHRRALKGKRVIVLDIPDEFPFMDPELVKLVKTKMLRWLPNF